MPLPFARVAARAQFADDSAVGSAPTKLKGRLASRYQRAKEKFRAPILFTMKQFFRRELRAKKLVMIKALPTFLTLL